MPKQAVKIQEGIYWVGGLDWDQRNFHGYLTQRGITYNAYLIIDDKITLLDTVKYYLFDEMIERISSVIDPSKIDIIVSNHVEMDHSGGLPRLMEIVPNATIITSVPGEKGLKAHYSAKSWTFKTVTSNDTTPLGKRSLQFFMTQMVHWPDNMVTYLPEEQILFSNDAFGQHLATPERFISQLPTAIVMEEASKYYANIVLPFGNQVAKAIDSIKHLPFNMIAPSHGVIWDSHIPEIIQAYSRWMVNETENKALVIYDSMWESTTKLAHMISNCFEAKNIPAEPINLKSTHISDIMTKILTAKYIAVGSPTLNNNMLPTVAAFLTYMRGLAPKNRIGLAFGSYGWGGQSVGQVEEVLKGLSFTMLEQIKVQYIPSNETLAQITENLSKQL